MTTADVIIIGGGPSGVAAGLALRKQGVPRVVLLEREAYLGGATRHCAHSPFGMREFGRVYFGAAYGRRLNAPHTRRGWISAPAMPLPPYSLMGWCRWSLPMARKPFMPVGCWS
ncbi:FAD-dependent oxidoreductase [Acetobacter papayae]|uniref:FAD-dependent oxidoreductase n=1 Tax=Acetobacter papayae TaxID=1076592 RepID=UPI000A67BAF2|nr:FAD-dependent oxidoreductase [Acetobacter papayae]